MATGTIKRNVDSIGPEDMIRPEIKLIQNTGGDVGKAAGAKPGQFFNAMSGEVYTDGFEFVVLDFSIQRVYWGRDTIGDEAPICSSLNAANYESMNGDNCHECEHLLDNAAMVDAKARREKCTKQYSFMGLLLPNLEPFIFRAPGTSSGAIQALISRFRFNKTCWNAGKTTIDYHRFKVTISASEQKTKAGSAWVIKFGDISPFNDANFEEELFLTSAQMLGQASNLLEAQTETGAQMDQREYDKMVKETPASTPEPEKTQPATPKINVINPKHPSMPLAGENAIGQSEKPKSAAPKTQTSKASMDLDI